MGGEGVLQGEFAGIEGWSKRGIKGESVGDHPGHYEFSIDLGKEIKLLVRGGNPVSVDVVRPNHASERVWYHEQRTRRVSKSEYKQIFGQH